jgi:7-cyano-7-deazaguanine synthase in queuosine biosynthesis
MTPNVTIRGCAGRRRQQKTVEARLGYHIRTDPRPIAKHCLKPLAAISEDIATIVESMALADRSQKRLRSEAWSRRLELEIPVYEFDTLSASSAHSSLTSAACFLTGDDWQIKFVRRLDTPALEQYLPLAEEQPEFVVPLSDGLDSFAQSKLLKHKHGDESVLEIRGGKLQKESNHSRRSLVEVSRGFRVGHSRERSYRTRSLVYFSFAAIGAAMVKAKAVIIGENGQGALGPSFARFSNEWPFRSAHPGFVSRLGDFLSRALDTNISFAQPQLWRTKGDVLDELRRESLLEGWERTRSCSVRPLQRKGRRACGYCGGCMLRHTALNAAGIDRESDTTFDLSSPQLVVIAKDGSAEEMSQNEREILTRAALSMARFAELPLEANVSELIAREARDIRILAADVAEAQLKSLVDSHAAEWRGFLEALPEKAWLSRQFLRQ